MKILVFSDSHGNTSKMISAIADHRSSTDLIVHLGDGAGDMRGIMREFPEKTYLCGGNCDFFSPYPEEGIIELESVRIFYCHGHKFHVKSFLDRLAEGRNGAVAISPYMGIRTNL